MLSLLILFLQRVAELYLSKMKADPTRHWDLSPFPYFLPWSIDFLHLSDSQHLTPICLPFITLSSEMDALASLAKEFKDNAPKLPSEKDPEEPLKNKVPVSFCMLFFFVCC